MYARPVRQLWLERYQLSGSEAAAAAPGDDATRAAYLAWVAAVKQRGGTVVAYPYHGTTNWRAWPNPLDVFSDHDTYGVPCARYPMAIAGDFDQEPDNVATPPGGDVAYYLAPSNVLRWATSSEGIATLKNMQAAGNDQVPPENNDPDWYRTLKTVGKVALIGGGLIVALQLAALVPHPKNWE
jgi:hypothetical protein